MLAWATWVQRVVGWSGAWLGRVPNWAKVSWLSPFGPAAWPFYSWVQVWAMFTFFGMGWASLGHVYPFRCGTTCCLRCWLLQPPEHRPMMLPILSAAPIHWAAAAAAAASEHWCFLPRHRRPYLALQVCFSFSFFFQVIFKVSYNLSRKWPWRGDPPYNQ